MIGYSPTISGIYYEPITSGNIITWETNVSDITTSASSYKTIYPSRVSCKIINNSLINDNTLSYYPIIHNNDLENIIMNNSSANSISSTNCKWFSNDYLTTTDGWYILRTGGYCDKPLTPAERMRQVMKGRLGPTIIIARKPVLSASEMREVRARTTLRRILGEDKFRAFLRNGFISVRAKSGLIYQIFPGHGQTVVIDKGRKVEKLCVVLQGGFSPTDEIIMRYLLILNDETNFRAYANVFRVGETVAQARQQDHRPLVEIYKELTAAA